MIGSGLTQISGSTAGPAVTKPICIGSDVLGAEPVLVLEIVSDLSRELVATPAIIKSAGNNVPGDLEKVCYRDLAQLSPHVV